jgi:hypothetical protein
MHFLFFSLPIPGGYQPGAQWAARCPDKNILNLLQQWPNFNVGKGKHFIWPLFIWSGKLLVISFR